MDQLKEGDLVLIDTNLCTEYPPELIKPLAQIPFKVTVRSAFAPNHWWVKCPFQTEFGDRDLRVHQDHLIRIRVSYLIWCPVFF